MKLHTLLILSLVFINASLFGSAAQVKSGAEIRATAIAIATAAPAATQSEQVIMPKEIHEFLTNASEINPSIDLTGLRALRMFLNQNPNNINAVVKETEETIAMLAARSEFEYVYPFSYNQGCDLKKKDKKGWTVLHHAASKATSTAAIAMLTHDGADKNAKNNDGLTPYDLAKKQLLDLEASLLTLSKDVSTHKIEKRIMKAKLCLPFLISSNQTSQTK